MTIAQMKDYFLILQDKYGSPYFTDSEIETFINRGQLDEITALLPKDGSELNIELNQNTLMRLAPILHNLSGINMAAVTGKVLRSALDTAVASDSGVVGAKVLRVLAVGWNDSVPVKYTRKNNWFAYLANSFKTPTTENPRLNEVSDSWVIRPIDITANLSFMVLRYPQSVSLSTPTHCEFPDLFQNEIVARALELAGVGSRDQMLAELQKLNRINA